MRRAREPASIMSRAAAAPPRPETGPPRSPTGGAGRVRLASFLPTGTMADPSGIVTGLPKTQSESHACPDRRRWSRTSRTTDR